MSLFSYNYGSAEPIAAIVAGTSTELLFTAGRKSAVVLGIRASQAGSSASTTLVLDVYDGTTAVQVRPAQNLGAFGIFKDEMPIVLPPGSSLRATKSAGDPVHVTGVVIVQI